jgi:uncharacterized membrane protein YphA (DoxX/SURF4 family)
MEMAVFLKHGRALFAISIIALGAENLVCAHCEMATIPVIPWVPATPLFAYLTGIGLLFAGVNLVLNWRARLSAVWSGIFFLVSVVLLQLPRLLAAPFDLGIRTEAFETLALSGASFMLAGTLSAEKHYLLPWENAEDAAIRAGRLLFAGSCLIFGIDHLVMLDFISNLIPSWIPAPMFWASFTGFAFIGASICIATKRLADVASTLLGIMFMLWFLVLHVPRILSSSVNAHDPNEWSSAFIALAMCGSAWICAWAASEKQFSTIECTISHSINVRAWR